MCRIGDRPQFGQERDPLWSTNNRSRPILGVCGRNGESRSLAAVA